MSSAKIGKIAQIEGWLLARRPEISSIGLDQDLIENRIIDSLGFMEFLYFLEELAGREIEFQPETLNSFRTLRSIHDEILNGNVQNVS